MIDESLHQERKGIRFLLPHQLWRRQVKGCEGYETANYIQRVIDRVDVVLAVVRLVAAAE